MNLSYWEYKTWLSNIDFTVVGSGIVGLNCALALRQKYPSAKIVVLEKGILPEGASTKNAGFACYGSISEILSDLRTHTEEEVVQLVRQRWNGIQLLRKTVGDSNMDFQQHGGHELFLENKEELYTACCESLERVNALLKPVFKTEAFRIQGNVFHFDRIKKRYITNTLEGQIDTGKMMSALLSLATKNSIQILNAVKVEEFQETGRGVEIRTNAFSFYSHNVFLATNGFAAQLIKEKVRPARAQVLITQPIPKLHIQGTFHLDEGYWYFRNIDDRILFGGGRHLDFKGEETYEQGATDMIQNQLEKMLSETILPGIPVGIAQRWSGTMGMGETKKPICRPLSDHVFCGVRLGGMGIAIGSLIGKELAELSF